MLRRHHCRACGDNLRVLRKQDVMAILKVLVSLKDGQGDIDDIDHLGNRRVRSVGELMENQYRIGLLRMERAIRERMGSVEIDTVMPADLINAKPAVIYHRDEQPAWRQTKDPLRLAVYRPAPLVNIHLIGVTEDERFRILPF